MILSENLKHDIINYFKDKKIAVLYGGQNEEREVSLRSGQNVYKSLKTFFKDNCILIDVQDSYDLVKKLKEEKVEYCYNILHGTSGEDGTIQGVLESLNIKYTGENILVSAVCMNKVYTKRIWKSSNVPTADFFVLEDLKAVDDNCVKSNMYEFNFPIILKPISSGSSVGVSLIKTRKDLENAVNKLDNSNNYFIEPFIKGKEITVGLIKENDDIYVFPILGVNSKNEIYDYEAKYTPGKTELEVPAKISKEIENRVIENCKKAYSILGCSGLCRIDAMISEKDNEVYLMEVNTQSGMTETSDIPAMAKHIGMGFEDIALYVLGLLK